MTVAAAREWQRRPPFLLLPLAVCFAATSAATPRDAAWEQIVGANRRTAQAQTLQYGKGHPFERYSSHRYAKEEVEGWQQWSSDNGDTSDVFFDDNRYPALTETPTTNAPSLEPTPSPTVISYDPSLYKPIRITVDSRRLLPLKEDNPRKYAYLIDYIATKAGPEAAQFWSDHLSTIPVEGSITITEDDCPLVWSDNDDPSGSHSFDNTDLVLYLLIDQGPCLEENPTIAFSNDCAMDQFDRPIAGTLLICSEHFMDISPDSEEGRAGQQKLEEVLQHELAHVLGMSGETLPYWRDASNGGRPYTPRPLVETEVECINGETQNIIMPSQSTIMEGATASGARYFEVVTPTVRNVVANQFDCEDATGARLDNNEYYNCLGSHWSPRLFGTETMVSRNMPWEQSISAVTLALFEDTGWYRANYSASAGALHPSAFGYGAGCDFMTSECIVDGEVPDFGSQTFCTEETQQSAIKCDVSHKRAAKCDLVDYNKYADDPLYTYSENTPDPPSEEYQHFANPGLGSFIRFDADYCPTYAAPTSFTYDKDGVATGPRYMECSISDTAPTNAYAFESFGTKDSRCFNTVGEINRPVCLSMECIQSDEDVTVAVSLGNGETLTCDEDGQLVDVPGMNMKVECPRKEILCPGFFCPANCSGRGICRHDIGPNGCHCFDPNDASPLCSNSPLRPIGTTTSPTAIDVLEDTPDVLDDEPGTSLPTASPTTNSTSTATSPPSPQPTLTFVPDEEFLSPPSAASTSQLNWLILLTSLLLIHS